MNFPFDTDKTSYAYIRAEYRGEHCHLYLYIRPVELARVWSDDGAIIRVSSQGGGIDNRLADPEPMYALRTEAAGGMGDYMGAKACIRAGKYLTALEKAIAKIDAVAGAPAVLLEDYMLRVLIAAKVKHVYCPERIEREHQGGSIPDMPHFQPAEWQRLHGQIRYLKRELLRSVYPSLRDAA